ncbi:Glucose/arabinose dehydrogenase, beta-propeller fold [Virgibacillus subterraneus]|uniref:Glucose/arabinose dehydrogenase, beta-propeller fold n=1 Tax=Virgibacillus subterraneus TaxID=621109 RepID=A0A1H9JQN4_9BACI|nr:PQQ-dependent sugar dehydrogenase [Virgibacillus subterraneus]SEQ89063.1 Glucose/arabinose dehydrogenase, beta-propeller fold [Virgibacillus subterraneus]
MNKTIYLSLLGIIFLGGLVFALNTGQDNNELQDQENQDPFQQEAVEVTEETVEVVASDDGSINANNLFIPWTINKSGNNFFLSQRDGSVIQIDGDLGLVEVQDVEVSEDILHEGQGGFLGFTLAPDFNTSKMAFAYHTYQEDGEILNRIISMSLKNNIWTEEDVLLEGIPGGEINTGGRIQIGPDEMLYATTGDTGQAEKAQELDSLAGKILRMELNGEVPEDNPFDNSYIYSFGHRNPQGLAWDYEGNLYSSEHGESGHDEINLIKAGQNYGWPVIEGDEEASDMIEPIHHSGDDTWAPSGMAFNDGQLFVASLAGSNIFTYDIASSEVSEFFGDAGRLRDIMIEDEALFTITNNHDDRGEPSEKDDRLIQIPLTEKASTD